MKKLPGRIISLIAAVLLCGGCASKAPGEMTVLAFANTHRPIFDWELRSQHLVLFYRLGEYYFLQCFLRGSETAPYAVFTRNLGKNIVPSKEGLFFENGRMHLEYTDSNGEKKKASVPFGNIYGDKHVSEMPGMWSYTPSPYSKKYPPGLVLQKDEPAVEAFLPTLQKHLRSDDAENISLMIRYPIEAEIAGGKRIWLEDRNDFLKYYPEIFTEELKQNLLKSRRGDIRIEAGEFMIGRNMRFHVSDDGKVHFWELCKPDPRMTGDPERRYRRKDGSVTKSWGKFAQSLFGGECTPEPSPEITVLEYSCGWNIGPPYLMLVYRQNDCIFLTNCVRGYGFAPRLAVTKNLGKNIVPLKKGKTLYFGDEDRMWFEYIDDDGKPQKTGFPLGQHYGDRQCPEMPGTPPLYSDQPNFPYGAEESYKEENAAINTLRQTLRNYVWENDAEGISRMVVYPVQAEIRGGKRIWLRSRQDFLKYYPEIFTENCRWDLLKSLPSNEIFCCYDLLPFFPRTWFRVSISGETVFIPLRIVPGQPGITR